MSSACGGYLFSPLLQVKCLLDGKKTSELNTYKSTHVNLDLLSWTVQFSSDQMSALVSFTLLCWLTDHVSVLDVSSVEVEQLLNRKSQKTQSARVQPQIPSGEFMELLMN